MSHSFTIGSAGNLKMSKLLSRAVVELTPEQIFQMRNVIEEADAASRSGPPGMLIAQIWTGDDSFMLVEFITSETALKIVAAKNPLPEVMDEVK